MRLRERGKAPLRCPYCHEQAGRSGVACGSCGARQHEGCWEESRGRCGACGSRAGKRAEPVWLTEPPGPPLSGHLLFVLGPVLLLVGLAVVSRFRPPPSDFPGPQGALENPMRTVMVSVHPTGPGRLYFVQGDTSTALNDDEPLGAEPYFFEVLVDPSEPWDIRWDGEGEARISTSLR